MILDTINYVPTLGIRPSEMNALEYLPSATKNRLMPCIILAPWVNSYDLGKSIKRFEKAYPDKPYFLDLDRVYSLKNSERPALKEMKGLLDPTDGYKNWLNFIKIYKNVCPCIQYKDQDTNQIQQQIQAIKELGRPYCLRIDIKDKDIAQNISNIIPAFENETNYTIILESGWVQDPLTLITELSGFITKQLSTLNQDIPIVISCTSFPKGFGTISGVHSTPFKNRQLVDRLRNNSDNRIIYGDWGSARPRENILGGSAPIPRIDYPTKNTWYIARNKQAGWNYQIAANKIITNNNWLGRIGIWGEEMIERTAKNQSLGINTPQKNVASRINIHLHLQAFYDTDSLNTIDLEDDFVD